MLARRERDFSRVALEKAATRLGAPEVSFGDDPLRMLRAARFASQLGFSVEPAVVAAMVELRERIAIISAERVRDELVKLICSDHPHAMEVTAEIVSRIPGLRPLDSGGLSNATPIEAFTAVLLQLNVHYKTRVAVKFTGIPEATAPAAE